MKTMNISDLQKMLRDLGYAESRHQMKELAERGAMDERIARAAAPDVVNKGRLPAWSEYSPENVSLVGNVESSVTDIRITGMEIDDAMHALSVLAGKYDDSVRDGRQTYSVDGAMPQLTSAAHEIRRAAL